MMRQVPFLDRRIGVFASFAALALLIPVCATAQFGGPPPPPRGPAKTIAPIDLTGYWVSIVTEDWRFRMITPPKGDLRSLAGGGFVGGVPLNPEGRKVAESWDPAK